MSRKAFELQELFESAVAKLIHTNCIATLVMKSMLMKLVYSLIKLKEHIGPSLTPTEIFSLPLMLKQE
ncbi:CLUMA_CG016973, isoform A [Clunio marinus]|uniref:CLUMA_CG016973, isoform A n=1 Tax=Clunio marinus TaxID=568069 RepID=A0A1J1IXC3_9DIPT|nr:CLUMA_CG016973, isoform A [Clunio marinus]